MPIIYAFGLFCCDEFEETPNEHEKMVNMSKLTKDCNIKKETNLEAYISVNFLQILTKSAPLITQIFPAFQRDAL